MLYVWTKEGGRAVQISRLFEMLYILLESERITASQLAERLEVSVRTVYRDAQALCEAGIPVCTQQGQGGGISILPGYKLSKSFLSENERTSLLAALQAMAQTGAGEKEALRKLSAFFGADGGSWVQIDFADWSGTQDTLIATLKTAILGRRVLSFDYYGEACHAAPRRVCPLTLWFKGQSWYLRAYCLERKAVRTFKLSRLRRTQIIPGEFPPEALEAKMRDEFTSSYEDPPQQEIVLRVDPCMAFRALDDFGEERIMQLENGDLLVRASFPEGAWIASIILGYGEHAQVLQPENLKHHIRETIQKMHAIYET